MKAPEAPGKIYVVVSILYKSNTEKTLRTAESDFVTYSILIRNRKIVWEHGRPHRNLYVILEFGEPPKTSRIILR